MTMLLSVCNLYPVCSLQSAFCTDRNKNIVCISRSLSVPSENDKTVSIHSIKNTS